MYVLYNRHWLGWKGSGERNKTGRTAAAVAVHAHIVYIHMHVWCHCIEVLVYFIFGEPHINNISGVAHAASSANGHCACHTYTIEHRPNESQNGLKYQKRTTWRKRRWEKRKESRNEKRKKTHIIHTHIYNFIFIFEAATQRKWTDFSHYGTCTAVYTSILVHTTLNIQYSIVVCI